jgi:hypothetical protein
LLNRAVKVTGFTPELAIYANKHVAEHNVTHFENLVPEDLCTINCWEKKGHQKVYAEIAAAIPVFAFIFQHLLLQNYDQSSWALIPTGILLEKTP